MQLPFFSRPDNSLLIARSAQADQEAVSMAAALSTEKDELIFRQSELWSLGSLSPDLETEYRQVVERIQYIARKLLVLETYRRDLANARYACQQDRKCDALSVVGMPAEYVTEERIAAASPTQLS